MKILFTGASSFTGYWFVKSLSEAGHDVVATFTGNLDDYDGIRLKRVKKLMNHARIVWNCKFGTDSFFSLIKSEKNWDVFCLHGANVKNYKSEDFDIIQALKENSLNAALVLDEFQKHELKKIIYTGSVFEANEGLGEHPLRAFSPYGLSKGFTSDIFEYLCQTRSIDFAKFVIPNPFGPYEEERFTNYLVSSWLKGITPNVNTPEYIRDNIHISLLSILYLDFVEEKLSIFQKEHVFRPSGYIESQGAFAQRFAKEIGPRLGIESDVILSPQTDFSEPLIRVNDQKVTKELSEWSENYAWDELSEYYLRKFNN